jgi:hypothetical protein
MENAWLATQGEGGPLDDFMGHSITFRVAVGTRAGQKLFMLQTVPAREPEFEQQGEHRGAANAGGFSLHAEIEFQSHLEKAAPAKQPVRVAPRGEGSRRSSGWHREPSTPDVIESAGSRTGKAHVIKSHHNVGGLPEHMKLKLVEPLRELFKDEVRKLGLELGLPPTLIHRHPFPGPGLGVRILGEVTKSYADLLRAADVIFIEELRRADLYDTVSQAFAVFLPVRSVGVMGDGRRYDYVVSLRAVQTIDFMTARWARLPYEFLDRVSHRIINEVAGISRVVYDISGKPPATIEWE